jgi:hypothetical protein
MRSALASSVASLASLFAFVPAAACHHDAVAPPQPAAVKVARVEHAASAAGTHYSAQINPATRLDLSFKVGGYVDSVATVPGLDGKPRLLQDGDRVRAGMQLAAVRRTDYAQKLAEAQVALAQARLGLDIVIQDLKLIRWDRVSS